MLLPQLHAHRSVESAVLESAEFEIVRDDVQHHGHLTEHEHLVASLLQFNQHLVQNHHLAANVDDFAGWIVDFAAWIVDEERMVAHFAQQHHDVTQLVIREIGVSRYKYQVYSLSLVQTNRTQSKLRTETYL